MQARRPSLLASLTIRQALARATRHKDGLGLHSTLTDKLVYLTLQGFGWAIAKALAEAGAEISLGVWVGTPE